MLTCISKAQVNKLFVGIFSLLELDLTHPYKIDL